jgi:hypothetical protein
MSLAKIPVAPEGFALRREWRWNRTPSDKFINEHAWALEDLVVRHVIEKTMDKEYRLILGSLLGTDGLGRGTLALIGRPSHRALTGCRHVGNVAPVGRDRWLQIIRKPISQGRLEMVPGLKGPSAARRKN